MAQYVTRRSSTFLFSVKKKEEKDLNTITKNSPIQSLYTFVKIYVLEDSDYSLPTIQQPSGNRMPSARQWLRVYTRPKQHTLLASTARGRRVQLCTGQQAEPRQSERQADDSGCTPAASTATDPVS